MACSSPLLALLAFILIVAPYTESSISCGTAVSFVSPCINYLRGMGPLTPGCCNGIKALNSAAKTTPDRQQACNCLKAASTKIPGLKPQLSAGLPGKCGVSLPYSISTSINCANVK